MLTLIDNVSNLNRGEVVDYGLARLLKLQAGNIERMRSYYIANYVPIDATNPILKLLYGFNWALSANPMSFYNSAYEDMEVLCSSVGITTSYNRGQTFQGIFFGEGVSNALVLSVDPANRRTAVTSTRWRTFSPLKVITRPGVRGAYVRPDLLDYDSGNAVIAVDVPMLAYQYRLWYEYNSKLPLVERERPEHFLGRYVFPNMLYSQMDAIMVNSLLMDSVDEDPRNFPTPLAVMNHTEPLLKSLRKLISQVSETETVFDRLLTHMPSFKHSDMSQNLPRIHDRVTEANAWVALAMSLPMVSVCVKWGKEHNPEWGNVLNLFSTAERRIRTQRVIEKVTDLSFRINLDTDYTDFIIEITD